MTPNLKGLPTEPLVVRVFCAPNDEAGGNPAPIVLQAQGMSSEDMRRIAESFGHEAGFVLPRSGDDHDLCMRYFVPNHEMEMCGHATVGALWLLREHNAWDGSPIRIRTLSGVVALSGFLYTKKNKLLIFSILVNNHNYSASSVRNAIEKFIRGIREKY